MRIGAIFRALAHTSVSLCRLSVFVVFVGRSLSGQYFGAMKGRFCPEIKDFADTSVRIIAVRIIGRIIGRFEKRKLHAVTYLGGEVGE